MCQPSLDASVEMDDETNAILADFHMGIGIDYLFLLLKILIVLLNFLFFSKMLILLLNFFCS